MHLRPTLVTMLNITNVGFLPLIDVRGHVNQVNVDSNVATYEHLPTLVTMLSVTNVGSTSPLHVRVLVNLVNVTLNVGNDGFESVIGNYFSH